MRFAKLLSILVLPLTGCENMPTAATPESEKSASASGGSSGGGSARAERDLVPMGTGLPAESCTELGEVTGSAKRGMFGSLDEVNAEATRALRRRAHEVGADYVRKTGIAGSDHEVLITGTAYECSGEKQEGDKAPPPAGAAGFVLGDDAPTTEARCRRAGHTWSVITPDYGTCSGAPVPTGLASPVAARFCDGSLCAIGLSIKPEDRSAAAWIDAFTKIKSTLVAKYGQPASRAAHVPVDCRDDVLPCLDSGKATSEMTWRWSNGVRVVLRMGRLAEGESESAIRLRYEAPAKGVSPRADGL